MASIPDPPPPPPAPLRAHSAGSRVERDDLAALRSQAQNAGLVPPAAQPSAPRRRRRRWLIPLLLILVVLAGAGAAAVLLLLPGRSTPAAQSASLALGADANLSVKPASGGCDTTFVFDATGTLTGAGTLVYRWEQSDGTRGTDIHQAITADVSSFHFVQAWKLQGPQVLDGSMVLHVLQPTDRSITRAFQYHCP